MDHTHPQLRLHIGYHVHMRMCGQSVHVTPFVVVVCHTQSVAHLVWPTLSRAVELTNRDNNDFITDLITKRLTDADSEHACLQTRRSCPLNMRLYGLQLSIQFNDSN